MPGIRGKQQAAALRLSEEDPAEIASKLDIQYNPEIINGLISDLQVQLEAKCGLIQKDIDFMSTSIKQAFHLELIKLPTEILHVGHFVVLY